MDSLAPRAVYTLISIQVHNITYTIRIYYYFWLSSYNFPTSQGCPLISHGHDETIDYELTTANNESQSRFCFVCFSEPVFITIAFFFFFSIHYVCTACTLRSLVRYTYIYIYNVFCLYTYDVSYLCTRKDRTEPATRPQSVWSSERCFRFFVIISATFIHEGTPDQVHIHNLHSWTKVKLPARFMEVIISYDTRMLFFETRVSWNGPDQSISQGLLKIITMLCRDRLISY